MLMPSIFGENLFDDWFDKDFFPGRNPLYGKNEKNLMKTDVREEGDNYEVAIDLPGFKKEDVTIELENGYLTITAAKGLDKDQDQRKRPVISAANVGPASAAVPSTLGILSAVKISRPRWKMVS